MNKDLQDSRPKCERPGNDRMNDMTEPVRCSVRYSDAKWIFDVPREGSIAAKDSKQVRSILHMMQNIGILMEPDDIEQAASTGPFVVKGGCPADDDPMPRGARCLAESLGDDVYVLPEETDGAAAEAIGDGDGGTPEGSNEHLALEATFMSGSDPDMLMLYKVREQRHTGDAGDRRLVHDLDRRIVALDAGIAAAQARGHRRMAAALDEERAALRTQRNWYINAVTGTLKPFRSPEADDKAHRCRMWIKRGLQALAANGLPKAAADLSAAISRGMEFVCRAQPGYEWVMIAPAPGSVPVFPKAGANDGGSEVAT